jgi:hypothetical protein
MKKVQPPAAEEPHRLPSGEVRLEIPAFSTGTQVL